MNISFSSAVKQLLAASGLLVLSLSSVQAGGFISGAEIRAQLTAFLAEQGMSAAPALDQNRQFRACAAALVFTPLFGSFQTIQVRCPDADGWKIAVRTKLNSLAPAASPSPDLSVPAGVVQAVIVNKRLTKHTVISPSDVYLEAVPASAGSDYFTRLEDVVGRRVKNSLRTEQIIRARHLETDWLIEKGQPVILESRIGAVQVLSEGIALHNAQWGELARFLNVRSDKEVFGTVMSEKKVVIRAKTSQN